MKPKYSEYDNFRWINCNRWSTAKEVNALVDYLVQGIASRKVGGYRINMKALVLDLYHSYICDPEQYLAYSRVKTSYQGAGSDHPYIKNPNVSYDYLLGCIDSLIAQEMIDNCPGGQFYDEEENTFHSYVSRMRPLPKLKTLVEEYGVMSEMITEFAPINVVVLRGKEVERKRIYKGVEKKFVEKPELKCPKNKIVTRMTTLIRQYNSLLERSQIDVDIECLTNKDRSELVNQLADMDVVGQKRIVLRLSNKSVYRVFNNGSLEQGGRYYGAWWISAPGIVRKYITIQGEPTVELDFSAMHVHLLYAIKGINYADMEEDAYTLENNIYSLDDKKEDRAFNKLILLTAFNAKSPESTASAVFDQMREEHKLIKYNLHSHDPIKGKLALLKQKHPLIADMVANNYGLTLQYYDSCVVEKVIKYFTGLSIPVLTVHDSIICQANHAELVKNTMLRYYYQAVEELLALSIKPTSWYSKAGYLLSYLTNKSRYRAGNILFPVICKLNAISHSSYIGSITDTITNTLNIKTTSRSNSCSKRCKCNTRSEHRLKFIPNIKLELKELEEANTTVLLIK